MNRSIIDQIVQVEDRVAWDTALELAKKEGILSGISTGAIFWAALDVARQLGPGATVVAMICDTGERYLSMDEDVPS
ncbi:MAG: pyridoxal-phosphate dependent enzyme [Candidatus Omnitrophica bacterium]|nr:pyridoxal-phosphate dependent enzyme [Candidatus Omnitrophota bacterium]